MKETCSAGMVPYWLCPSCTLHINKMMVVWQCHTVPNIVPSRLSRSSRKHHCHLPQLPAAQRSWRALAAQVSCKEGPTFTYDHVYGGGGEAPDQLYAQCVQPLVAGLFKGYNACCFAYGQTGSGKTYTMGSSALGTAAPQQPAGVIPNVMRDIFERIAATPDADFAVRVGFVEIFNVRSPPMQLVVCHGWPWGLGHTCNKTDPIRRIVPLLGVCFFC